MRKTAWVMVAWCGVVLAAEPDGGTAGRVGVTFRVGQLKSQRGAVECVLWAGADGFPYEPAKAAAKVTTRALARGEATCTFAAVPTGTYAVSFIHDENENGKMDTGLFGRPLETYGFSRDTAPFMRAPHFDEASFAVGAAPVELHAVAK